MLQATMCSAIGAHHDDEFLGPGSTLAKHAENDDEVHILIVNEGTTTQYDDEIVKKETSG